MITLTGTVHAEVSMKSPIRDTLTLSSTVNDSLTLSNGTINTVPVTLTGNITE